MAVLEGGNESGLNSMDSPLFQRLNKLMTDTMTKSVSYSSLTGYWDETDNNIMIYSDTKASSSISREHVWPKSRASFHQQDGGSDIHHLRPENSSINSTRSNYTMGNVREVLSSFNTASYSGKTVLWYNGSYTGNGCDGLVEVADNVKGDVARIFLYVYVRWEEGNLFENDTTPKTAGNDSGGNNGKKVIESLETLLQWCEEDPVDTWEMTRNDLCQDVQGNRNVFIDYPEFAWLLFGQDIPNDMKTPSGEAANAEPPVQIPATVSYIVPEGVSCNGTTSSYVGSAITLPTVTGTPAPYSFYCWSFSPVNDTTASVSGYSAGKSYTLTAEKTTFYAVFCYKLDEVWHFTSSLEEITTCEHSNTEVRNAKNPTCTVDGYTGDTYCKDCGSKIATGTAIPAKGHGETELRNAREVTCTQNGYTGNSHCLVCGQIVELGEVIPATGHNFVEGVCSVCGAVDPEYCPHSNTEIRDAVDATCTKNGYTGDTYCKDCGKKIAAGTVIPATGHDYVDGSCLNCGKAESNKECTHENTELRNVVVGSCTEDGYTGDTYCKDCGIKLKGGMTVLANGHDYVEGRCADCGRFAFEAKESGDCYFDDFSDCSASWYHEAVDFTVANGLMNGMGGGIFAPDGAMTRAMIVTVLYRQAGSPEVKEPSGFRDVAADSWYSDAIAWAKENGIVNGISETEFAPEQNVTREQIATILWRCSLSPDAEADLTVFGDGNTVSDYAETAICWAVSQGILSGDGKNLNPGDNATRAQFACMIMRYLEGSYTCK